MMTHRASIDALTVISIGSGIANNFDAAHLIIDVRC